MVGGDTKQYVLLPARELRGLSGTRAMERTFLLNAERVRSAGVRMTIARGQEATLRVLDSIHEDGAKLVEMSPASAAALRAEQPGLRIVPVVYYEPALAPRRRLGVGAAQSRGPQNAVEFEVVDQKTGAPVAGALVVAFTNVRRSEGAQGTTSAKGRCKLTFAGRPARFERVYVYPRATYWGALYKDVAPTRVRAIALQPVSLGEVDGLRHRYPTPGQDDAGTGVRVGVLDTGIDPGHPDLRVEGGLNTVVGEPDEEHGDNGLQGHGTHVAGILAGRGQLSKGLRGLAPGVTLRSYRVFGRGQERASNYSIAKAIDRAVSDGCDILNLSLGGPTRDDATAAAIEDAHQQGVLIVAAAGNDGRRPVSYPAADAFTVGVSALGRKGTYPAGTVDEGDIGEPFGVDPDDYIALFSNFGEGVDLTGPGVAIVSTLPGSTYGVMSGTSMAAPAVAGLAASLLGRTPALRNAPRNADRATGLMRALFATARSLGFGPEYVGRGLP